MISRAEPTFSKNLSPAPEPKRYFTVVSMAEKRMCKRGIRAIFFGTRTSFIRAVPKNFRSVNGPLVITIIKNNNKKKW